MNQPTATRHPIRHALLRISAVLVLAAGMATAALASDTAGVPALSVAPPAAHWVERKLDFTYQGFTDKFTCDGLRDIVREVLRAMGARKKDFTIQERGCTHLNGVEPSPGIAATFSVLVPMTPDDIGKVGNSASLPTQWHTVDLVKLTRTGVNSVPCELLEELKRQALPLFTTRNLKFRSACFPHQESLGDIDFTVDVLRPAAGAEKSAAEPGG